MISHTLFTLALAGAVTALPDWTKPRPNPAPNANPTDTNELRLNGKRFEYANLPQKVDTASTERGIQVGYNICNESTAGDDSLCQTLIVNTIDDFCLWGPQTPTVVGDAEAGMVAFCTKDHGARRIPAGALTAVQFLKTRDYIAIGGRINQALINVPTGDTGGELDSGGQDARGNPIGAVLYSNNLPGTEGKMTQSIAWTQFLGGDRFCLKACSPTDPNAANNCEHVYDTIGCDMNVPMAYAENVFESCDAENAHVVGELVSLNTVILPASSNCKPAQSADLYAGAPTGTVPVGSTTSPTSTSTRTTPGTGGSTTSKPGGTNTNSGGSSPSTTPDAALGRVSFGALAAVIPVVAGLLGAYLV